MKYQYTICYIFCCLLFWGNSSAQKPFVEGTILYKVKLTPPDKKAINGTYEFSFKGTELRKELQLDNGYQDVTLINCTSNTVYSLQNRNDKKYAIQLNMEDLVKRQLKFKDFSVIKEELTGKKISGLDVYKASVLYTDSTLSEVLYTKEWRPTQSITYNRYPGANFMPLRFVLAEDNGIFMVFEAVAVEAGPVATSTFRIPDDYKMISYEEYKQLRK